MMRWRALTTPAVASAVVRRPLWSQLASRALSTGTEEEETTGAPRKQRVFTDAQRKRFFAAKAKQVREKEPREFALLPSALKVFHETAGHFIVPLNLRCVSAPENPTDAAVRKDIHARVYGRVQDSSEIDWPEDVVAEELKIGQVLKKLMVNVSHRQNHSGVVSGLRAMGFPVEEAAKDWRMFIWNHQTLPALETFHKLKGHAMVHQNFVVPHGDSSWPETTWGFPLGGRVSMIRHQISKYAPQQLVDLERLGFSFNFRQTQWNTRIMPSFKVFASENGGHCRIPQLFIVPSHAPWPPAAWGMKLGSVVRDIRSQNQYARQVDADADSLKSLGFQHSMPQYMWNERILPSLEVFKQVYGHCDVGKEFVVPSEQPWPEEAWGDKLGAAVSCIRSKDYYADQVAKDGDRLDAIGFVWNSSDNKWTNLVLPALEMYFQQFGDTQIPTKFVVPSEDPWPQASWGLKLGLVVYGIKYHGTFAKQRQQDHVGVQAIGLDEK